MSWFVRRQLKSRSVHIRRQAVHSLRGLSADVVVPLIETLLATEDQKAVLIEAIKVLGGCKGLPARKLLIARLGNPDPAVRLAAVEALDQLADPDAAPELVPSLTHLDPVVRGRAAQVLKHLGWQPKTKAEEAAFLVALGDIHRAAMLGAVAVGPLTSVLGDTAYQRRVQAVNRLADIGDPSAVKPLILALVDQDDVVRMAASDALGRLGDARAKNPLLPMLKDRNAGVRAAAAGAMGAFGDATLVDALVPLLDDPHWEVRMAALESLGRLHDNRATEAVARCLRDPDREVREKAAECLGMLGDPAGVGPLVAALVDADRFVRQWARLALQRVNPHWEHSPDAHAQIDLLRSAARSHDFGQQYAARETLRSLGDSPSSGAVARRPEGVHGVADLIAGFLGDPDASVRQAAVEALARLPGAIPDHVLQPLRHDPDASVATAALGSPSPAQATNRPESA